VCSRFWGVGGQKVLTFYEQFGPVAEGPGVVWVPDDPGSTNVAPTEPAYVLRLMDGQIIMDEMRWRFTVPGRQPLINARIETILEKPLYAKSARERRCIVPAQGFYEWDSAYTPKQPHCFRRKDGGLLSMAGVWREVDGEKQFCVITTEPNGLVENIHSRMPAILEDHEIVDWLQAPVEEALSIARDSLPAGDMEEYRVTRLMSNPRYKGADASQPMLGLFDEL
jgi:putative SOS response-associated peptidase YedK